MKNTFSGIIPPVVTLFDEQGDIHWDFNKKLADWLIDQGVHGILLLGSTGEFSALTIEERMEFADKMIAHINGRVPVLVGTGSTVLKDTITLSQHAESVGANGVLVVNPFYWKYTNDQLYNHFTSVAKNISIPMMIYNFPALTGYSLDSELVCRLASNNRNIVGIKDTVESIGHIREINVAVRKVRPDFAIFSAFDDHLLPNLQMGGAGSINGTAIFAPRLSVELFEMYQKGNYEKAILLHQRLINLMSIYQYGNPFFKAIKEAVHQGVLFQESGHRLPSDPSGEALKRNVCDLLKEEGLI